MVGGNILLIYHQRDIMLLTGHTHRHRIHGNRCWLVDLSKIIGSIVRLSTVQELTRYKLQERDTYTTLCTFQKCHVKQNNCTTCEPDLNKTATIKHNNDYLNMTSICAVLVVSFGWETLLETLLHSLHYQLIKGNWCIINYCGLNCIHCSPVTNTLEQSSQNTEA